MRRLFISIPINLHYTKLCNEFIQQQQLDKIRWIKPENWHVTLIFIGYFHQKYLTDLANHLTDFFSNICPFSIDFEKFIYQPEPKNPRMIWAKFKQSYQFDNLVQETFAYLKEWYEQHHLEFNIHIRNTNIPHITLARPKQNDQPFPKLKYSKVNPSVLEVKDCHLFESKLLPKGAEYHLLHTFSFDSSN
ncbi:MAG: RNA 2',3'-cyclic phosphodiesterase [Bacteroidetes bacterium]|jgi:RNA 2',3'-cyclic 3'-phosphodiesterase|nr:RNA 2',3'-cyclic phosphodiesterase [Bacteroidota bacterium]MBT3422023.1 RNA 2',3'-cyclic phosphodiesterase [Bacteroidota bacterium]MBT3933675.1 RNA 2',3'-cyclic phosphodiesterase [Bacteroidota bacterium]